jgi:hypothetical protein
MPTTAKTRTVGVSRTRTGSGPRQGSKATTRLRAQQSLTNLASSIRTRLLTTERSAAQRDALSELERYERAIGRWASVPSTETQSAAMLEQLLALQERVERLAQRSPTRAAAPTTKPPPAAPPRVPTTTKLPRTRASKPPRSR